MEQERNKEISSVEKISDEPVKLVTRIGATKTSPSSHPVFVVDDTFFRSRTPKSTHWSVAWSDLMMTMFILFLTLFVYQLAHREFLSEESPEVLAGTSMPIPQTATPALPFHPISPSISNKQTIQLKKTKVEQTRPVAIDDQDIDAIFEGKKFEGKKFEGKKIEGKKFEEQKNLEGIKTAKQLPPAPPVPTKTDSNQPSDKEKSAPEESAPLPRPQKTAQDVPEPETIITRMYDLSKITVADEKLEKFASVELIPDKTMRIILTGDLLFPSGQAELTRQARKSLRKLIPIIRQTPYMINVIGHTDSMPMHSEKYSSNWELSTARAGRVARFLIEAGHIPASHFVVSGYSYFRPVKPNTTSANRKANRRVEIIISREPPPAQSATKQNIK